MRRCVRFDGCCVGEVEDLPALLDLAHRLLDANKTKVGAVTTGDTGRGRTLWGYGRSGRPCRRCGTLIKRGEQAPRSGTAPVLVPSAARNNSGPGYR